MKKKSKYWIGKRPWDGTAWVYTTSGMVLEDAIQKEEIFRMYRRYVKQRNDIELDLDRSLLEYKHEIYGAKVLDHSRRFILQNNNINNINNINNQDAWILEVNFARGFSKYYPGFSVGLNTLRSSNDIRSMHLHWSQLGDIAFSKWLETQKETNKDKGEWTEYKA